MCFLKRNGIEALCLFLTAKLKTIECFNKTQVMLLRSWLVELDSMQMIHPQTAEDSSDVVPRSTEMTPEKLIVQLACERSHGFCPLCRALL
mmetsp:Transcript_13248/g.40825  ORF Transcript_13248/g.40825 Transcript_13248/m.40825 type:complete len:91 (-) Transcript_13248:1419-1691(-)